jgi:hypothetical protein
MTVGSRRISSSRASLIACLKLMLRAMISSKIQIVQ